MSGNKIQLASCRRIFKIATIALILVFLMAGLYGCGNSSAKQYKQAVSLLDAGSFEEALAAFELIKDYEDSADMIERCKTGILDNEYNAALALMNEGRYEEAITAFTALDYKDSAEKAEACRSAVAELEYNKAIAMMDAGNYVDAAAILKSLNYEDSAEKYEECRATAPYDFTQIGDIITFGCYEQDNVRDDNLEPLKWRVLDKQDGKLFIITEQAVEMLPYFGIYWKHSHIGGWLNYSFIMDFTAEEKAMIVKSSVSADAHPDRPETDQGSATKHGVYLLSVDEVLKYFPEPEDRVCYATEYLQYESENTSHLTGLESDGRCAWWLRTALDNFSSGALIADIDGNGGVGWATHNCRLALRPVCWIQLEDE